MHLPRISLYTTRINHSYQPLAPTTRIDTGGLRGHGLGLRAAQGTLQRAGLRPRARDGGVRHCQKPPPGGAQIRKGVRPLRAGDQEALRGADVRDPGAVSAKHPPSGRQGHRGGEKRPVSRYGQNAREGAAHTLRHQGPFPGARLPLRAVGPHDAGGGLSATAGLRVLERGALRAIRLAGLAAPRSHRGGQAGAAGRDGRAPAQLASALRSGVRHPQRPAAQPGAQSSGAAETRHRPAPELPLLPHQVHKPCAGQGAVSVRGGRAGMVQGHGQAQATAQAHQLRGARPGGGGGDRCGGCRCRCGGCRCGGWGQWSGSAEQHGSVHHAGQLRGLPGRGRAAPALPLRPLCWRPPQLAAAAGLPPARATDAPVPGREGVSGLRGGPSARFDVREGRAGGAGRLRELGLPGVLRAGPPGHTPGGCGGVGGRGGGRLASGCWVLGAGCWVLGAGVLVLYPFIPFCYVVYCVL
ncbi:hypothetical protein B484DRAFT_1124 [Ochromonadaceae sp. CCMP2298]|nr:hypothetical protein B484DRAFT_1124 [Ochromonadaceae sp. CCMP2298]